MGGARRQQDVRDGTVLRAYADHDQPEVLRRMQDVREEMPGERYHRREGRAVLYRSDEVRHVRRLYQCL
jgi:hypothetical protein